MRTIVASEFFCLLDLSQVTHVSAVQAGAPEGESIALWPPEEGALACCHASAQRFPEQGHEVRVEVGNLQDPAAVLRLEILVRSSLARCGRDCP
jgi:hypothetical protein